MRVGMTTRRIDKDTGEWQDGNTSYVTVTCWRTLANNVASCLRKGEPVVVRGKFKTSSYEDRAGRPRSEIEIEAETVGHDLGRGVAHFQRTRRLSGETAADLLNASLGTGEMIRSGEMAQPADEEGGPGDFDIPERSGSDDFAGLVGDEAGMPLTDAADAFGGELLDDQAVAAIVAEGSEMAGAPLPA
jgi:single-strand DNA-binding protein